MKYYKVVRQTHKELKSAIHSNGRFSVTYYEGEWASAVSSAFDVGYGLCVFDDIDSALEFCVGERSLQLWECEVNTVLDGLPVFGMNALIDAICGLPPISEGASWPGNTVMVKSVKLLRRIQ